MPCTQAHKYRPLKQKEIKLLYPIQKKRSTLLLTNRDSNFQFVKNELFSEWSTKFLQFSRIAYSYTKTLKVPSLSVRETFPSIKPSWVSNFYISSVLKSIPIEKINILNYYVFLAKITQEMNGLSQKAIEARKDCESNNFFFF